ncbi:probable amino-acid racemase [Olea europaea subsp. europaea]|uniref:Probable amino-acid racemase n=1 Tax=Olea europaea subsp. europaea TaxID=158383 RepID=A0A8S0RDH8_OLEEU|nr:probable amino-acid racemase [Olea europaea subsp. europaea]
MSTISFHKLNFPSIFIGNLSRNRINHRTKRSLSKSKKIICSNHIPKSLINQENTVGIIGGLSTISTLTFLEKMVYFSLKNNEECFPFIVCSDPAILKRELSVHHSMVYAKHVPKEVNHGLIIENLRGKREFLEKSGSRCIVMSCYVCHLWHEEVFKGCSVISLNMFDCVARELKEAKMKPLEAGSSIRIGVLASDLVAGSYQKKLQIQGLEAVLPDKPTVEHIIMPAIEALNKNDIEGARNLSRIAIQTLLIKGVNLVILGSDEFQELLPRDDPLLKRCLDPMDSLARSTVKWAHSDARMDINLTGFSKDS